MLEYKGFKIANDGTYGMCSIKPVGRGSIPTQLRGTFTKVILAQQAITQYLDNKGNEGAEEVKRNRS